MVSNAGRKCGFNVQDIDPGQSVWDRLCVVGPVRQTLRFVVTAQFILFIAGIVLFGVGIASSLIFHRQG
jgi:hypothetical protein